MHPISSRFSSTDSWVEIISGELSFKFTNTISRWITLDKVLSSSEVARTWKWPESRSLSL